MRSLIAVACLVAASATHAAETAGMVKKVTGPVSVARDGKTVPLAPGDPIFSGEKITTGKNGSVGVTLKDDTLIASGPNSVVTVGDFKFNTTTNEGSLLLSVVKGTLHVISGLIARHRPESVLIRTPTATAGIRGTEFIVEVEGDEP